MVDNAAEAVVDPGQALPFATRQRYAEAIEQVKAAASAYYDGDEMLVDDATYDAVLARIAATEAAHPGWRAAGSPTGAVAGGAAAGGDIEHSSPMLGLDNVFAEDQLRKWAARLEKLLGGPAAGYTVEPKIDGLAIAAWYVDGKLVRIATRGDGRTGEDVTGTARRAAGLPGRLSTGATIEVRGEVFMTDADFEVANAMRVEHDEPVFAHPRSAAAGTLRADKRGYHAPLSFFAYAVQGLDASMPHSAAVTALESLGVMTTASSGPGMTICDGIDEVLAAVEALREARATLGFGVDGAVIKADAPADRELAGSSSKAPRWAIAYKFPADTRTTTLLGIDVQVGRTGVITPVATLAPVLFGGVKVTSATLHNFDDLVRRNVRVGDTVFVRRAGDVIPEVVGAKLDERPAGSVPFLPPAHCPRCGGEIDRSQKRWRCTGGRVCGARQALAYYATRNAMDIEGLGEKILDQLVGEGMVTDPADLYDLDAGTLATLERFAELSSGKLVASIAASKERPLSRLLTALGIRMAGRAMSRRLAAHFGTMRALLAATIDDLQAVDGVGPERAVTIAADLAELTPLIDRLADRGVTMTEPGHDRPGPADEEPAAAPLRKPDGAPMKVVVTGAVPGLTRDEGNEAVERLGGTASGSVSGRTDLVVVGAGAGSKVDKAVALGVRTMPAERFAALLAAMAEGGPVTLDEFMTG
ncbi:NAD-dependent DNA ligase LigA [Amycolatopsis sp. NPDC057786]|uniref:NAD-dependent DNA ligase LigA n=1 Tax=Amycolatopsis sp. NPDC057786 TaxID=3346250 RepID=UPI00366B8665